MKLEKGKANIEVSWLPRGLPLFRIKDTPTAWNLTALWLYQIGPWCLWNRRTGKLRSQQSHLSLGKNFVFPFPPPVIMINDNVPSSLWRSLICRNILHIFLPTFSPLNKVELLENLFFFFFPPYLLLFFFDVVLPGETISRRRGQFMLGWFPRRHRRILGVYMFGWWLTPWICS